MIFRVRLSHRRGAIVLRTTGSASLPRDHDRRATVTVDGPDRIGSGDRWHEFEVTITAPSDSSVEMDVLELSLAAQDGTWLRGTALRGAYRSTLDDWTPLRLHSHDGTSSNTVRLEQTVEPTRVDAGTSVVIPVRLTTDRFFHWDLDDRAPAVHDHPDRLDLTFTVTLFGPEQPDASRDVAGTASKDVSVRPLPIDAPTELAAELGTPVVVDVAVTNTYDVPLSDLALYATGVPGITPWLAQPTDHTDDATRVEYLHDGEWVAFDPKVWDPPPTIDLPPGDTHATRWRFTFLDPTLLQEDRPTTTPWPGATPHEDFRDLGSAIGWAVNADHDGNSVRIVAARTALQVVEELPAVLPTETSSPAPTDDLSDRDDGPTPSPTVDEESSGDDTDPATVLQPAADEAPSEDEDGAGDDGTGGGEEAGDRASREIARTGHDLSSQAALGLLLLFVGASAVLAALRNRRAPAARRQ